MGERERERERERGKTLTLTMMGMKTHSGLRLTMFIACRSLGNMTPLVNSSRPIGSRESPPLLKDRLSELTRSAMMP